jgi:predicted phosphodiesterase
MPAMSKPRRSIFRLLPRSKAIAMGLFPNIRSVTKPSTPFGKLHMEHYPLYSSAMEQALKQDGVRIFIHGHTHEREEELHDGLWVYCPGSLTFPHDNDLGTYLVLEVSAKEVRSTFKTIVY